MKLDKFTVTFFLPAGESNERKIEDLIQNTVPEGMELFVKKEEVSGSYDAEEDLVTLD